MRDASLDRSVPSRTCSSAAASASDGAIVQRARHPIFPLAGNVTNLPRNACFDIIVNMDDSESLPSQDEILWSRLTQKQRDCLELLLERKTSKQIAQILGISKDTVDQRLTAARKNLRTADRNEAALTYDRLKRLYDRVVYDPAVLDPSRATMPPTASDGGPPADEPAISSMLPTDERSGGPTSRDYWRPDLELTKRVTVIVSTLLAIVVLVLAGLAIGQSLTQLNAS